MSGYQPGKPDGRIFASYPMPAKIDLINERPRRESLIEQQLSEKMSIQTVPKIQVEAEQMNTQPYGDQVFMRSGPSQIDQQSQFLTYQQPQQMVRAQQVNDVDWKMKKSVVQIDAQTMRVKNSAELTAELAAKEAKLMADINALQTRPYSPFQVPAKIDLTSEVHKSQKQQQDTLLAGSPRPYSRSSSARSTSAELLDKEAKLMQEIDEMEKKPFNPQTMIVEREQWFEYPEGRPQSRHLTESKRRVKDFCSLPSNLYSNQDAHMHEENLLVNRPLPSPGSLHTAIIKTPKREIDNKSPLPFSFDNFSTKGVRGNIASVGAIEPDRPRPPIYPIIRRTPSPSIRG